MHAPNPTPSHLFDALSTRGPIPMGVPGLRIEETRRGEVRVEIGAVPNGLSFVRTGVVRLSSFTSEGRELVLEYLGPGDIFGESMLFGDGRSSVRATVHAAGRIATLDRGAVRELLERRPQTWASIAERVARRERRHAERTGELVLAPVKTRVEMALRELAQRFGVRDSDGARIPIRFSHDDLARFVGANRVSVTLAIGELEKTGVISQEGRRLRVRAPLLAA